MWRAAACRCGPLRSGLHLDRLRLADWWGWRSLPQCPPPGTFPIPVPAVSVPVFLLSNDHRCNVSCIVFLLSPPLNRTSPPNSPSAGIPVLSVLVPPTLRKHRTCSGWAPGGGQSARRRMRQGPGVSRGSFSLHCGTVFRSQGTGSTGELGRQRS